MNQYVHLHRFQHDKRLTSTATVEEVESDSLAVAVGGNQASVEVWKEVDRLAVVRARCKDTRHLDQRTRQSGVRRARTSKVTETNSVDKKSQQGVLVGGSVVLEKSSGVLVTD